MQNHLILADLHLTSNILDEYRWRIFSIIKKLIATHNIKILAILGDLTHRKDNHDAKIVNRIVQEFKELSHIVHINILKGNHDYHDPDLPFFNFLSVIENLKNIGKPQKIDNILYVPHGHDFTDAKGCKYVFFHDAVRDFELRSDKVELKGVKISQLNNHVQYIGGHFHTPQDFKNVLYVGAPYHINYGDQYNGRCIVLGQTGRTEICLNDYFPKKYKILLSAENNIQACTYLKPDDQLKITYVIKRCEIDDWNVIKSEINKYCEAKKIILKSIDLLIKDKEANANRIVIKNQTNEESLLLKYVQVNKLSNSQAQISEEILKNIKKDIN